MEKHPLPPDLHRSKPTGRKITFLASGPLAVRRWLRAILPASCYSAIIRIAKALVTIPKPILGWWYRNDLNRLALLFRTDKWGAHWYTQHYQRYFESLKGKRLNLLEIGVGGYENSSEGGESLRMWKAYFRKARIVGIDLYDKTQFREHRIDIRQCDQTDAASLRRLSDEYGGFDVIIDDGSHLNKHIIETFLLLFPLLRNNGIYVVEDTQTAYWPRWGGGIDNQHSAMAFFKKLVDGLNYVEFPIPNYQPGYFEKNIVEIAFFHNLVFIRKGNNDEKANAPEFLEQEIKDARESSSDTNEQ